MLNFKKEVYWLIPPDNCEAPHGISIAGTRIDIYAPVLALGCVWGAQIGFKACTSIAPKTEILGRYFWSWSFIWYALMSLFALFCHCVWPGVKWAVTGDCVSTGVASISIVYALATDAGHLDDSDMRAKISHGLLTCLYVGLGVLSHLPGSNGDANGWIVEGLYFTLLPCAGMCFCIVVKSTFSGNRTQILGHWGMKAGSAVLTSTIFTPFVDQKLCSLTQGYFNMAVIVFFLSDIVMIILSMYFHGTMFERWRLDNKDLTKKTK